MKKIVLILGTPDGVGMATAAVFAGEGWHVNSFSTLVKGIQ